MTAPLPDVAVIMPTLAAPERAGALRRAITSVLNQHGVRPLPIVVVNGPHPDPGVLKVLRDDARIRLTHLPVASLRAALRRGREQVDAPWFAELDDDDVLLEGALAARVRILAEQAKVHVVVTNGYRREAGRDRLNTGSGLAVRADPLRALLAGNWLLPGSWLCRTERFGPDLFDRMPQFLECTYLAVRFALSGAMTFLDEPTVAWTVNGGESSSPAYQMGQPAALRDILALDLPPDFRAGLTRHLTAAYHSVAEIHRAAGRLGPAWQAHLASLRSPGGWRYLAYSRHLLHATISGRSA